MAVNLFTNGAGGNTWGTAGNWSQGTIPTATDGHVTTFDATSPNCTVNASNRVCNAIDFTGYTNTITMSFIITVSGNITLDSGMNVAGSAAMGINAAGTITSNGFNWPNNLTFSSSAIKTISGNLIVGGTLTLANHQTINATTSETISVNGLSYQPGNAGSTGGTIKVIITGGTWSGLSGTTRLGFDIDIDGNVTLGSSISVTGNTVTYVSGTITNTGSTLTIGSSEVSLDTDGMAWNNVSATTDILLISDCLIDGVFTTTSTALAINKTATETLTAAGGIAINVATSGDAKVILTGGTWSGSSATGIANDIDLQGNVTISTNVYYRTGILTYVSGTITTTSSTLNLTDNCTLNTDGMSWNNITLSNTTAKTYTISSLLSVLDTFTIGTGATTTFAGTAGWTAATVTNASTGATTVNFKEAITYTITTSLDAHTTRNGSSLLLTSSHASTKAKIVMTNPSTCNLLADLTRIDASGGRTLNSFGGVVTDCINCRQFFDYQNVGL